MQQPQTASRTPPPPSRHQEEEETEKKNQTSANRTNRTNARKAPRPVPPYKRGNRNAKRTETHKNKITQDKTQNKPPHSTYSMKPLYLSFHDCKHSHLQYMTILFLSQCVLIKILIYRGNNNRPRTVPFGHLIKLEPAPKFHVYNSSLCSITKTGIYPPECLSASAITK